MSKLAVVYWSGTGNTESMAEIIANQAKEKGIDVDTYTSDEFNSSKLDQYQAFAFGCPSMGVEVLEEDSFQPMWDGIKDSLSNKNTILFGSYGWGDGEWMQDWKNDAQTANVIDTYICNDAPQEEDSNNLKELVNKLFV